MNQDQVKTALIELRPVAKDFTLVFSGRKDGRVNGTYQPMTQAIVINNRNFETENDLFFTALHEYAHHIMITEKGAAPSSRAHTTAFYAVLHELVGMAEAKGLYENPARKETFTDTTDGLKKLITESGEIMIRIGRALIEAQTVCFEKGARFDDYVMRVLKQTMPWARACMAAAGANFPADLGAENMKMISSVKSEAERETITNALEGSLSPQQVKTARIERNTPDETAERIKKELGRISRTIEMLTRRQRELGKSLEEVEK